MINTALIPARGGSKGLKDKNIALLHGKPLIAYTIEAALKAETIDRVIVSSDSNEILEVASSYGAECVQRPSNLALDNSPTAPVITHAIQYTEQHSGYITLLQPTSPLRGAKDIDEAFLLLSKSLNVDCVISVKEPKEHPLKAYIVDQNGCLTGAFGKDAPYTRRQDLPKTYYPNGAIYCFGINAFQNNNCLIPTEKVKPYLMCDETSIDIDCEFDLKFAERILNKEAKNGRV